MKVVPRVPSWLRHGAVLLAVLVAVEYLVVPELIVASHDLDVLGRLQPAWLLGALALEIGCWVAYAVLLQTLVHREQPLSRLVRLVLATTALSHVMPGGAAGGAGLGFSMLTADGVPGSQAAFALATESIGSAIVLNVLLWLALLVTIPLAGLHPVYVVIALLGLLAMLGTAAMVALFTTGEARSVRAVRWLGRRVPRLGEGRAEALVHQVGNAVSALAADRKQLRSAVLWSSLNWLLDAASLWACFAALGHYLNPFELFAAYGIANVLAVIPVTPAGLGVIEASAATMIVSFGTSSAVAALGVLGWRLLNFWLPIPVGGVAYLTLLKPGRIGQAPRSKRA